ncbi:MAG TPA: TolC family protein, partial [Verrucomicrobiae bacterium]
MKRVLLLVFPALLSLGAGTAGAAASLDPTHAVPPPPALVAAIALAWTNNPEIRVLAAGIDITRGEAQSARAWANPEFSFAPGWKRTRSPGETQFHGDFSLEQTFEWPGKRALRQGLTQAAIAQRRLALDGYRQALAIRLEQAWFNGLTARDMTALQSNRLDLATAFVTAARERSAAGYASEFEVIKAEAEAVTARKSWQESLGQSETAAVIWNSLQGLPPTNAAAWSGTAEIQPPVPELFQLLNLATQTNPALRLQNAELERLGWQTKSVRRSRWPDFTVGPNLEYTREEQIFGLGVRLPLPLWNDKRGELATAHASQAQARAEAEQLQQEILTAVTAAAKKLAASQASLAGFSSTTQARLASAMNAS